MSVKMKKLSVEAKEMKAIRSLANYTDGIRKAEGKDFKSLDDVATTKAPDVWRKKKGKKSKAKRKTKNCGCE